MAPPKHRSLAARGPYPQSGGTLHAIQAGVRWLTFSAVGSALEEPQDRLGARGDFLRIEHHARPGDQPGMLAAAHHQHRAVQRVFLAAEAHRNQAIEMFLRDLLRGGRGAEVKDVLHRARSTPHGRPYLAVPDNARRPRELIRAELHAAIRRAAGYRAITARDSGPQQRGRLLAFRAVREQSDVRSLLRGR